MAHLFAALMAAQDRWARPFGDFNHRWASSLFRSIRPIRDLLNGTWLGHPLHPLLASGAVGILSTVVVLDVLGQPAAADIALVFRILAMLATAVAGLADYSETEGTALTRATLHGTLMVVALVPYAVSLVLRAGAPADRTAPVALSVVGFVLVAAGAFVGGDVSFVLGNMVNRHAWRGRGAKWIPLELKTDEIPEGTPTKAKLGINDLVLVRQGETILALHDQCAHAGGPLSGGTIVDGCIECPWHGSRYRLTDGRLRRGPAVYDQPTYEIRRGEHGWEGRRSQA